MQLKNTKRKAPWTKTSRHPGPWPATPALQAKQPWKPCDHHEKCGRVNHANASHGWRLELLRQRRWSGKRFNADDDADNDNKNNEYILGSKRHGWWNHGHVMKSKKAQQGSRILFPNPALSRREQIFSRPYPIIFNPKRKTYTYTRLADCAWALFLFECRARVNIYSALWASSIWLSGRGAPTLAQACNIISSGAPTLLPSKKPTVSSFGLGPQTWPTMGN